MKQLLTYFCLAYLISWFIWLPLYGHIIGVHKLPAFSFQHALGGLGPLLAAVGTTLIYYGKIGLKFLLSKCFQLRPLEYLFVALLSPFTLALLSLVILHFLDGTTIDLNGFLQAKEFPSLNFLNFFIYNFLFFGLGEEVGWRGFALPLFQKKFSALTSSMLLTAL
ncbi:CPBP family glutamic-type intramembrane protease [Segetibacter aerophilus]|uniref:CPBP family glutamic-type intramembrane protease n=1 Tax=Segetibacter aerophilus TaxID=670293 RepID=UPI0011BDEB91|nr:CPBP family glutamic-type intramembrane protease [Segetibacter aerophilus]